ncbi:MAG: hypothetical protein HFF01_00905 [Erysipelotrichaceae bacterium]|jgi:hypothetical protein|nr:hypothetical protein [Erysipelotrichaceae bacterium]
MNYNDIKIMINGSELPESAQVSIEYSDLDSDASIRPITTGILRRNPIRKNIMKITIKCVLEDFDKVNEILSKVSDTQFSVVVYDNISKTRKNKTMYAGNRKFDYKVVGARIMIGGFSFNLIEV